VGSGLKPISGDTVAFSVGKKSIDRHDGVRIGEAAEAGKV
jgi:hypothetical protein